MTMQLYNICLGDANFSPRSTHSALALRRARHDGSSSKSSTRHLLMFRCSGILEAASAHTDKASDMRKPVMRCWNALRSRGGDPPTIADIALADLVIGCAYTLLVLVSLLWRDSWLGLAMDRWMQFTHGAVESALFFLPDPRSSQAPDMVSRILAYRHLMVSCAIVTFACTTITRRYWPAWSRSFFARLRSTGTPAPRYTDVILIAYHRAVIGMAGVIFLLLLAEPRSENAAQFLYGNSWAFFRAPLLLALICFLACHAAMLRLLLPAQNDE